MTPKSAPATLICKKWAAIGPKVAPKWPRSDSCWPFGGGRDPKELQKEPWDQVNGCKEAPGDTKEAPRRHQGGTKEAPGKHLAIVMVMGSIGHTLFQEEN